MLHFLPQQNRKNITIEYLLRVTVFLFLFIFLAAVFLITLFLPSVIFSVYNDNTIKNQLASTNIVNKAGSEDPAAIIKNVNAMVKVFSDEDASGIMTSDIIKKIISLKNDNIQILAINMSDTGTSKTFIVNGLSQTRDSLTAYDNNLLADGTFVHVDLPVSDLIPDSNNNFTITLSYTNKTSQ